MEVEFGGKKCPNQTDQNKIWDSHWNTLRFQEMHKWNLQGIIPTNIHFAR